MHKIKVLCAKPEGNDDRSRGRPKLRRCVELGNNIAQAGVGKLMPSQERRGRSTLRRSRPTQEYSTNGRRKWLKETILFHSWHLN